MTYYNTTYQTQQFLDAMATMMLMVMGFGMMRPVMLQIGSRAKVPSPEFLDPAMRNLVHDLNARGFPTSSSCEGHLMIADEASNAYVEFSRDLSENERAIVKDIIMQHTAVPLVRFTRRTALFRGSLRSRPTASPADAHFLLLDLKRGGGGPGRSVEKILSMYDRRDLEEMAAIYHKDRKSVV